MSEASEALMRLLRLYNRREWYIAATLFLSYIAVFGLTSRILPPAALFNPASAIALSTLYFGGLRLWPVVWFSALMAQALSGASPLTLAIFPVIEALQAAAGSYLLHEAHIDPLFRRYRDTFFFLATIVVISLISPTLEALVRLVLGEANVLTLWRLDYMAMLFSFLIVTPFLLRWFTKPRFSRTAAEVAETVAVFLLLILIDYLLFVHGVRSLLDIPLTYFLLIPLFWIALKLRPRFMTLAALMTSVFAVADILIFTEPALMSEAFFQMETFVVTMTVSFFIVTSLEEDRRVNTNIMHSQMAALRNAIAKESSESKAKNDFIAILSHELRNPLAPVLSSIDLLRLKGARDEEDTRLFDMMEDRMDTVRRLLDDLLDISRISEGKVDLKRQPVELDPVLKRAILTTEHHRKELHQRLITRLPQKPVTVLGDAVRLEQVFSNLLTNASKFSPSGESITLSMREHAGSAELEVADRGVGLGHDELETIFLPFRQTQEGERNRKGLGIGLTLVRNFVEMHGGTIEARSEGKGRGSRFIVRLPLAGKEGPQEPVSAPASPKRGARATNPLILIVDDNDAAAGSIGRLLEFQGYKVAYAYDGSQAITKARSLSPDAVFLDIGLPDQDGHEVAKRLRADGFRGRLIALTGYGRDHAPQADGAQFDHYLVKPVGIADLQRTLAGLV